MTTAAYVIAGLLGIVLLTHILAKVAARAWYKEKLRYHSSFMHELKKDNQ